MLKVDKNKTVQTLKDFSLALIGWLVFTMIYLILTNL